MQRCLLQKFDYNSEKTCIQLTFFFNGFTDDKKINFLF